MGVVYLVGAGPGDEGLFTVRGRALLESADCVVYDRLGAPGLLGRDGDGHGQFDPSGACGAASPAAGVSAAGGSTSVLPPGSWADASGAAVA